MMVLHSLTGSTMVVLLVVLLVVVLVVVLTTTTTYAKSETQDTINVFGLMTEIPFVKDRVSLERKINLVGSKVDLTICFHFKLCFYYQNDAAIIFIGIFGALMGNDKVYKMFASKKLMEVNARPVPWQWSHLCVVLGQEVLMVVDGRPFTMEGNASFPDQQEITLKLGLETTSYRIASFDTFGGYFTLPLVYPGKLSLPQMVELAECGQMVPSVYSVADWQVTNSSVNNTFTIHANYSSVDLPVTGQGGLEMKKVDKQEVCLPRPLHKYVFLTGKQVAYSTAVETCSIYKGSLPNITDPDFQAVLKKELRKNLESLIRFYGEEEGKKCPSVPARLEEDEPVILEGRCDDLVDFLVCKVPSDLPFKLLYNNESEINRVFYLVPSGRRQRFLSTTGQQIIFTDSPSSLLLIDANNKTIATAENDNKQFIGRFLFTMSDNITSTMTAVLTVCSQEEFTCTEGKCIKLTARCDGMDNCGDNSDEQCTLLQQLPDSYNARRPHAPATFITLNATLILIESINENNNEIRTWLKLEALWEDSRVTLLQLRDLDEDNEFPGKDLWSPVFRLENAVFSDLINYANHENMITKIFARKLGKGLPVIQNGQEGFIYQAQRPQALLKREESFMASYHCNIQLDLFPFDVHVCFMNITIEQTGEYRALFNVSELKVFSEASTLPLFTTSRLCVEHHSDEFGDVTSLSFKVLLQRRYSAYLFTTLGPCFIIQCIGYLTQVFDEYNFSDRIMVTVSCLIVVGTLFVQVATTIPSSAAVKAIDIFFFYSLFRLLFTFLNHSILMLLQRSVMHKIAGPAYNRIPYQERPGKNVLTMQAAGHNIPKVAVYEPPRRDFLPPSWSLKYAEPVVGAIPPVAIPTKAWSGQQHTPVIASTYTYDRTFNVTCIAIGYLMDIACYIGFVFWVMRGQESVSAAFKMCGKEAQV